LYLVPLPYLFRSMPLCPHGKSSCAFRASDCQLTLFRVFKQAVNRPSAVYVNDMPKVGTACWLRQGLHHAKY
ncbi:hypothetical protein, partial [Noviherbaspirillum agri]